MRPRCLFSYAITKNRCYQPSFCTVGGKGPKWSYQPCHPCTVPSASLLSARRLQTPVSSLSSLSLVLFAFKRGVVNRTPRTQLTQNGSYRTALHSQSITLTTLTHLTRSRTHTRTQHYACMARSEICLLYTSPSPRDQRGSRMPSSA